MRASEDADADMLARWAATSLERPSDYMNFDRETQYETHGAVMNWANRGDDLIAESNFHVMLEELNGTVENDGSVGDVLDRSASHWLVGSLRTIFVRVYLEGWDAAKVARVAKRAPGDVVRLYTPAFRRAVDLLVKLWDYPLLSDDDHSEREHEAWQSVVNDAIDSAMNDFPDDSETEQVMFYELLTSGYRSKREPQYVEYRDLYDMFSRGESRPDSVDWDAVSNEYARVRSDHFEWLAERHWSAEIAWEHRNQLALF